MLLDGAAAQLPVFGSGIGKVASERLSAEGAQYVAIVRPGVEATASPLATAAPTRAS